MSRAALVAHQAAEVSITAGARTHAHCSAPNGELVHVCCAVCVGGRSRSRHAACKGILCLSTVGSPRRCLLEEAPEARRQRTQKEKVGCHGDSCMLYVAADIKLPLCVHLCCHGDANSRQYILCESCAQVVSSCSDGTTRGRGKSWKGRTCSNGTGRSTRKRT